MTRSRQTRSYDDELDVVPVGKLKRSRSYVIYGRAGTGKTTLASSWPKPQLYLNCKDDGTDSIADVEEVDVKQVESFEDWEFVYWWLKKNPKKYRSVVIDTVSNIQEFLVQEIGGKGRNGKKTGDWGSMTKQDWGEVASSMKEMITNYRDLTRLGVEIVFIAQDRTFNTDLEDDTGGMVMPEVGPKLSPSVRSHLNAQVSFIGRTYIRERERTKLIKGKKIKFSKIEFCLGVGPNSVYDSKARKPRSFDLPDFIVNPSYGDIINLMKGVD